MFITDKQISLLAAVLLHSGRPNIGEPTTEVMKTAKIFWEEHFGNMTIVEWEKREKENKELRSEL